MFDYFVFADESGDLGAKGTPFFVVVAIEVRDERLLERIVKRARTKKLRREKTGDELKASSALPRVRSFILRQIAQKDCRVFVVAVDKSGTRSESSNQNEFYEAACVEACRNARGPKASIVLDKRYSRKEDQNQLAATLQAELKARQVDATVSQVTSNYRAGLQAADFIAWAAFQKFAKNDETYYTIIRPKVAVETVWNASELLRKYKKRALS